MTELALEIELVVGIYLMDDSNTPGVGRTLQKAKLDRIPEAHCYLKYQDERYDFTDPSTESGLAFEASLMLETVIRPDQIGDLKVELHRNFLAAWAKSQPDGKLSMTSEELWAVREECIQALSFRPTEKATLAQVVVSRCGPHYPVADCVGDGDHLKTRDSSCLGGGAGWPDG